jgi:uncharacterized protein
MYSLHNIDLYFGYGQSLLFWAKIIVEEYAMTTEEIKNKILPVLKQYEVSRAGLFGSVVRGEDREGSDVDLLVELPKSASLLDIAGLKLDLEGLLGRKVDVLTYDSIYHLLKERILNEEVPIL